MTKIMILEDSIDSLKALKAIVESVSTTYNELSIVGTLFYSEYAPMLVIIGIILIVSVIGAIAMTR